MDLVTTAAWILLGGVALVVTALATLAALPLGIIARSGYRAETLGGSVEARVAFGVLALRLSLDGAEVRFFGLRLWRSSPSQGMIARIRQSIGNREQRERWRRRARWGRDKLRAALPHWRAFVSMGRRFVRAVRYRFVVRGTVGLDDPADTALLFEVLRWLHLFFPRLDLVLARDYLEETLELDAEVKLQIWPPRLALVALGVLWTRETRQALLAVR